MASVVAVKVSGLTGGTVGWSRVMAMDVLSVATPVTVP